MGSTLDTVTAGDPATVQDAASAHAADIEKNDKIKRFARPRNRVGMPAALYLEEFGSQVRAAFGDMPYLVGSATMGRTWHDVDVRLILDDEEYAAMGLGDPDRGEHNGKWAALCMAFSELGRKMTGLPIDFQIQQRTMANRKFPDGGRIPLGFVALRLATKEEQQK